MTSLRRRHAGCEEARAAPTWSQQPNEVRMKKTEDSKPEQTRARRASAAGTMACLLLAVGCGSAGGGTDAGEDHPHATIGAAGGQLVGMPGTAFEGVKLSIPPGALAADTE